jgi:hypothetical protein
LIITAGEDARICFWHPNETNDSFVGANVIYQPQQVTLFTEQKQHKNVDLSFDRVDF